MVKRRLRNVMLFMTVLMMCSSSLSSISTSAAELSISIVTQAKTEWCWAASAEMAGKYAYSSSTRDQWDVVNHVHGTIFDSYPNKSGSIANSASGSKHMTHNTKTFSYIASAYTISQIRTSINTNSKPLQAGAGYYNSNGNRNGGHMVVISGVTSTGETITYLDPWDGTKHTCTLTAFGDASYNGRKYDQTVYY